MTLKRMNPDSEGLFHGPTNLSEPEVKSEDSMDDTASQCLAQDPHGLNEAQLNAIEHLLEKFRLTLSQALASNLNNHPQCDMIVKVINPDEFTGDDCQEWVFQPD